MMNDSGKQTADSGRLIHFLSAAFILGAALFAVFAPAMLRGEFLFLRLIEDPNNIFSFYPWNIFSSSMYHAGRFPLYNPFNGCGVPHLANLQSAPLYPLHLLLFIHPTRLAFDMFLILRLFLLGMGTYLFARSLGLRHTSALGGMLAAALNGYFMRYQAMVHLNVEILLPWALMLAQHVHERRRLRDVALLALVLASAAIGGNAESAFFLILFVSLWAVWLAITEGNASDKRFSLLLTAGALGLGLILSLAQVLPFLEYLPHAWHIHPTGSGHEWLDARGIVSIAAPDLLGAKVGMAPYIGASVMLFAVLGVGRDTRSWLFFAASLFLFALIYGPAGTKWLASLPGLSRTASLKYAFAPLGVMIAILAARGIESVVNGDVTAARVRKAAAAIGLFILFFVLGGWIADKELRLWSAAVAIIAVMIFAATTRFQKRIPALAAAVIFLELIAHYQSLRPKMLLDPDDLKNSPQIAYIIAHKDEGRMAASLDSGVLPNLNLLWGIHDVGLFDAMYPKGYVALMSEALGFDMKDATQYFKTHGYSFPISPEGASSPVWRELGVRFYAGKVLKPEGVRNVKDYLWKDDSAKSVVTINGKSLQPVNSDLWESNIEASGGQQVANFRYNYLPGWRAWLDDEEIKISSTESILMSVDLPDKGGNLELAYFPWAWRIGLWAMVTSLLSLTSLIASNILLKRRYTS